MKYWKVVWSILDSETGKSNMVKHVVPNEDGNEKTIEFKSRMAIMKEYCESRAFLIEINPCNKVDSYPCILVRIPDRFIKACYDEEYYDFKNNIRYGIKKYESITVIKGLHRSQLIRFEFSDEYYQAILSYLQYIAEYIDT